MWPQNKTLLRSQAVALENKLTKAECLPAYAIQAGINLKSHFVKSSTGWGGRRKLPMDFIELTAHPLALKVVRPAALQVGIKEIWSKAIEDKSSLEKNSNEG